MTPAGTDTQTAMEDRMKRSKDARVRFGYRVLAATIGLTAGGWAAPLLAAEEGAGEATVMSAELLGGARVGAGAPGLYVQGDLRALDSAPEGEPVYAGLFRVDGGADGSIAPASVLEGLGVARAGIADFTRADGTVETYSYGIVRLEFLGEMRESRVFFGPEDVEPALGTSALAAIGISVDADTATLQTNAQE